MNFVSADHIRSAFSAAMSAMYRTEVPAYGTLMELVSDVNAATLKAQPELLARLEDTDSLDRISEERHGAIRLGTAAELSMMRRAFVVMGMFPVGYYDLSAAGVPVHSTAFRPVADASLKINPFRVFTSLLRLDLIADEALRAESEETLAKRNIFTAGAVELIEIAEKQGGLSQEQADKFVLEVLETFRWHDRANVSAELYHRLHDAHRLIADVVSFKGPHINHLTPRTLDIDAVQAQMPARNISPKAVVEGPPTRKCAVLLRQTSFKALEEAVSFTDAAGEWKAGTHTARFGEIEQRGIALTPKGRALYDALLDKTRDRIRPAPDGSNSADYVRILGEVFEEFPDTWAEIREQGLGYFAYSVADRSKAKRDLTAANLDALIADGAIQFDAIVYEDFLPVSAAGIFQSNLGDEDTQEFTESPNQKRFEADLGATVLNEFDHYARIERESVEAALKALAFTAAAE